MQSQQLLSIRKAIKSYLGFLEGTGKALNTITNYRYDLELFASYLSDAYGAKMPPLKAVQISDLRGFHEHLKAQGQKANSRRRRVMAVRGWVKYLTKRNKLGEDFSGQVLPPAKIERIPEFLAVDDLSNRIKNRWGRFLETEVAAPAGEQSSRLSDQSATLQNRNALLLLTLLETGALVSEVCRLTIDDFSANSVAISGKLARDVPVSEDYFRVCQPIIDQIRVESTASLKKSQWLFQGFRQAGPIGTPITPRGVELLVKEFAVLENLPQLTPRTFRHSRVVQWLVDGKSKTEIMKRLGLQTDYAFRVYLPIIKKLSKVSLIT